MSERSLVGVEVGIVGTINRDEIVTPDGEKTSSLGGILYNVMTMAALLEGTGVVIRPVGRLGREDLDDARELLSPFQCVDSSTLLADPSGTNLSFLDYSHGEERVERAELRVGPLVSADLAPLASASLVLVNMISGGDVSVDVLRSLRRESSARFVLDVQALARTTDVPREPRSVSNWREWAGVFDVIRGNELEIGWFPAAAAGDVGAAVPALLGAGCEAVIVTRGARGATLWEGGRQIDFGAEPAVPRLLDPTGCGDSFLSGVAAALVSGRELPLAMELGVAVSSRVAGLRGLRELASLRDSVRRDAWARGLLDPPGPTGER